LPPERQARRDRISRNRSEPRKLRKYCGRYGILCSFEADCPYAHRFRVDDLDGLRKFEVAEAHEQRPVAVVLLDRVFLTRDSRTVERKKCGKAKACRSFRFSKR